MTFETVNLWHAVIAGVAAWILGFIYYTVFSKPFQAAMTPEELAACKNRKHPWLPFAVCLAGGILMSYVLAALLHYVTPNAVTVRAGAISAFFVWLGFALPPMVINGMFAKRNCTLLAIDAGYWLLALLLQGALLGAFADGTIKLPV